MTETKPMLSFPEAIKSCLRQYVGFTGRATRAEFWWWVLGFVVVSIPLGILDGIIFGFEPDDLNVFGILFGLATVLPWLAVTARRLHDTGRTGWWQILVGIPGLIPVLIGFFVAFAYPLSTVSIVFFVVAGLISVAFWIGLHVWLIWRLASQGQPGPNKYGPDPRA